jgi:hypothetical protein
MMNERARYRKEGRKEAIREERDEVKLKASQIERKEDSKKVSK